MKRIKDYGMNREFWGKCRSKTFIGLFAGVFGYLADRMTELIIVLAIAMILDYVLGIAAGLKTKGFDEKSAIWGTVKKLCYSVIVILGFFINFVIKYAAESADVILPVSGFFGFAVIIYLIGTKGFSCVQNLLVIGLKVPTFLEKAFGLMRDTAGNLVKVNDVRDEDENIN